MSIYHKDVEFDSLRLQDNKVVCYIFRKLLYCKNQMDISFELHTNADSRYNDVLYPSLKPHPLQLLNLLFQTGDFLLAHFFGFLFPLSHVSSVLIPQCNQT